MFIKCMGDNMVDKLVSYDMVRHVAETHLVRNIHTYDQAVALQKDNKFVLGHLTLPSIRLACLLSSGLSDAKPRMKQELS